MVETFWACNSWIYVSLGVKNDAWLRWKIHIYLNVCIILIGLHMLYYFHMICDQIYNVSTEKSTSNACFPRIQRRKIRWNEVDFTIKTTWYVDLWRTKVSFWMKKSTSLSSIGRLFQSKWYRMMWQSLTKKRLITDERRKIYWDWLGHMIATYHCYNC